MVSHVDVSWKDVRVRLNVHTTVSVFAEFILGLIAYVRLLIGQIKSVIGQKEKQIFTLQYLCNFGCWTSFVYAQNSRTLAVS